MRLDTTEVRASHQQFTEFALCSPWPVAYTNMAETSAGQMPSNLVVIFCTDQTSATPLQ